jgi:hypothetical protein
MKVSVSHRKRLRKRRLVGVEVIEKPFLLKFDVTLRFMFWFYLELLSFWGLSYK